MPIPLDIANLASSHVEDDIHLGTLDLANLNSSMIHNDLQPNEEPVLLDALQVSNFSFFFMIYFPNHITLIIFFQAHEINNNENGNSLTQLPDFLSDGPMQSSRMNQEPIETSPGTQSTPHNSGILEENARLRQQLEMSIANERMALARYRLNRAVTFNPGIILFNSETF